MKAQFTDLGRFWLSQKRPSLLKNHRRIGRGAETGPNTTKTGPKHL